MKLATVTFRFETSSDVDSLNERLPRLLHIAVDGGQGGVSVGDHKTVVLENIDLEEITPTNRQLALAWWRENPETVKAIIAYSNLPEYGATWWTGRTIEEVYNKISK